MNMNDFHLLSHRSRLGVMVLGAALGVGLPLWVLTAADVPNTFVNGEIADADEVNENFQALKDAIEENEARLEQLETSSSTHDDDIAALQTITNDLESTVAALSGVPAGAILYADDDDDAVLQAAGFERFETADTKGASAPPRDAHGAVWTGSTGDAATTNKMIVWGGQTRYSYVYEDSDPDQLISGTNIDTNSGGIYDPLTDQWRTISAVNAPYGRIYPGVVWTGSKMVVFGGSISDNDLANSLNTQYWAPGGVYDPTTDSWTGMSMTGSPTSQESGYPIGVWTGTRLIVFASIGTNSDEIIGGSYNPSTNTWEITPNLTTGNGSPDVSQIFNFAGGFAIWTGTQVFVTTKAGVGGLYNPAADTWSTPQALIDGILGADGILAGGLSGDQVYLLRRTSSTMKVAKYGIGDAAWTEISSTAIASFSGANAYKAVWRPDESFVVFAEGPGGGGWSGTTVAEYDVGTDMWQDLGTDNDLYYDFTIGWGTSAIFADTIDTPILWAGDPGAADPTVSMHDTGLIYIGGGATDRNIVSNTGAPIYAYRKE